LGIGINASCLEFHYGARAVFSNVCFSVEPGSFMGVVGPNGAGKTTLLKCLAGLLHPSSGHVKLGVHDMSTLSRSAIARLVAVVPQDIKAGFDFTCEEFVMMGRIPHQRRGMSEPRRDRDAVSKAMAVTHVDAFSERPVDSLSGGERQRAAIARALAQEPKVLLLDEPTSHLDIGYQVDMLDLVATMCADEGITVAGVFHDLNLASMYCHHILMMADGRAELCGTPREVLTQQNVSGIYGNRVVVDEHPVHDVPLVAPRSCRAQSQGRLTLVTGGVRSGKSTFAEQAAMKAGDRVLYVATCQATHDDAEMQERIRMHRSRRPDMWATVESSISAADVIQAEGNRYDAIILDCLGLFVTNHLLAQDEHVDDNGKTDTVLREVERLARVASGVSARVLVVTNEVGMGVVPTHPLGRLFRDVLGWANQIMAAHANDIYLCVAGVPIRIK